MSRYRVELIPEAVAEARESRKWYAARNPLAGRAFEAAVPVPERWPVIHREVRRCLVKRFPFAIFYRVGSDVVTVLAAAHTSRRPGFWRKR
jgi:toxin ParE1/3/4